MRFAFTLATLVAFAAAAPTEKGTDATGGGYSSYRPYTAYGVYPGAADAEAARMQTGMSIHDSATLPLFQHTDV